MSNEHPAIILAVRGTNSLGTLRNLGRQGIKCYGVTFGGLTANQYSRFCTNLKLPNPEVNESDFISNLLQFGRGLERKAVLYPMNDYFAMLCTKYFTELEPVFLHSWLSWETYKKCATKSLMLNEAAKAGVPVPIQITPDTPDKLDEALGDLNGPYIIKPQGQFQLDDTGNASEVFGFFHRYGKALEVQDRNHLMTVYREIYELGYHVTIQEMIPGDDSNLYTHAFVSDSNAQVIASFVGHKVRQYPTGRGTVTVGRSDWQRDVVELGTQLVKQLGFHGIGNTEFKFDERDNTFKLIEINARTGAFISLPTESGVNLSLIHHHLICGTRLPEIDRQIDDVFWVDILRDALEIRHQRKHGQDIPWASFFQFLRHKHVHSYFCWTDPLPFFLLPFQFPRSVAG